MIEVIENAYGHFHIVRHEANNITCIEPAYQFELEGVYKPLRVIDYNKRTWYGRTRKDGKDFIIKNISWHGENYVEKLRNMCFIDECGYAHSPGSIDLYTEIKDINWLHKWYHGVN